MINLKYLAISIIIFSLYGCNNITDNESNVKQQPNNKVPELSLEPEDTKGILYRDLEKALLDAENVDTLWLRNQKQLIKLDSRIGELINLKVLNVSGTNLKELPEEIGKCKKLQIITANACRIERIPNSIGQLKQLKNINFGSNKIKKIPVSLTKCIGLEQVVFGSNDISEIPEGFGNLKHLWFCDFARNNLTAFSNEFWGLEKVNNLWLHGNNIKNIPTGIANLKDLTHLLIDEREVENIEEIKLLLPELRIIDESNRLK